MSEEMTQPSESTAASEATTETAEGVEQSTTSYMDGKYNSVSALESGYKELQSTFSKKTQEYNENLGKFAQTVAPENYELAEGIETTSRVEALMEFGKSKNMSNEMLNEIIAMDSESTKAAMDAHVATQKELLGKDAETRLTNVSDWAMANLGEDNMEAFNSMITSAKGVEMFEMISKMSQGTQAAAVAQPKTMVDRDTIKQMRFANDEFGQRRMSSDPQYRAKVEGMEKEFLASGGKF